MIVFRRERCRTPRSTVADRRVHIIARSNGRVVVDVILSLISSRCVAARFSYTHTCTRIRVYVPYGCVAARRRYAAAYTGSRWTDSEPRSGTVKFRLGGLVQVRSVTTNVIRDPAQRLRPGKWSRWANSAPRSGTVKFGGRGVVQVPESGFRENPRPSEKESVGERRTRLGHGCWRSRGVSAGP